MQPMRNSVLPTKTVSEDARNAVRTKRRSDNQGDLAFKWEYFSAPDADHFKDCIASRNGDDMNQYFEANSHRFPINGGLNAGVSSTGDNVVAQNGAQISESSKCNGHRSNGHISALPLFNDPECSRSECRSCQVLRGNTKQQNPNNMYCTQNRKPHNMKTKSIFTRVCASTVKQTDYNANHNDLSKASVIPQSFSFDDLNLPCMCCDDSTLPNRTLDAGTTHCVTGSLNLSANEEPVLPPSPEPGGATAVLNGLDANSDSLEVNYQEVLDFLDLDIDTPSDRMSPELVLENRPKVQEGKKTIKITSKQIQEGQEKQDNEDNRRREETIEVSHRVSPVGGAASYGTVNSELPPQEMNAVSRLRLTRDRRGKLVRYGSDETNSASSMETACTVPLSMSDSQLQSRTLPILPSHIPNERIPQSRRGHYTLPLYQPPECKLNTRKTRNKHTNHKNHEVSSSSDEENGTRSRSGEFSEELDALATFLVQQSLKQGVGSQNAMIWKESEARLYQTKQIGRSACGPTAVLNILRGLNVDFNKEELTSVIHTNLRAENGSLTEYLFSRAVAGTLADDAIKGIEQLTSGRVYGRFFHLYPQREVDLFPWLSSWIQKGAVPLATLNLQKAVHPDYLIPDAWHHQMVYGVGPKGMYLTNPIELSSWSVVSQQLSSDSVLLVRREDITSRWDTSCDLSELLRHPDPRWRTMNVLGQVVNILREDQLLQRTESRCLPSVNSHVRLPAIYQCGITLFVKADSPAYTELRQCDELPCKQQQ